MSKTVTKLWGREFDIVKNGISEDQVVPFVDKLISDYEMLIQRQEHLSSLTKLAEKTVTEAEKLANETKTEATDQAKAEASRIIAEAEAQTQQIIEEKQAEAVAIATKQAEAIKAKAKHEAELILDRQRDRIQPKLSNLVHQLYSQLLSELEGLKQQVVASEGQFEHELSQSMEEPSIVTKEADEISDEFLGLVRPIDQASTGEPEEREPEWELEFLPPMDVMKIMGIVTYLDQLPEVEKTEIIPETDRPSIIVFLREPIQLIDALRTFPEVSQVKEDTTDTASADGKPRKVQIVLSEKAVPEDATKE